MLKITLNGKGVSQLGGAMKALSDPKRSSVGVRALNHTGGKTRTQVKKALKNQTGLKAGTLQRAVKVKKASTGNLQFELRTRGGDIALKFFNAHETRPGTTAAPFGNRKLFAGIFMKAGGFKRGRIVKSNWNGQAFGRNGDRTSTGHDKFEKQKSGVIIPAEMVKGLTKVAFERTVASELPKRIEHEIKRATKGVIS